MADTKISALTAATTPLAGTEVLPIVQSSTTKQVSVANLTAGRAVSAASQTISSGNLSFSSTAQRITGDFTNTTLSNRLSFQTTTVNGNTNVQAIPNGTATTAQIIAVGGSDPDNAQRIVMMTNGGVDHRFTATYSGTPASGTYLPVTFYIGGAQRFTFDTTGNIIPTTAAKGINFTANTPAAGMTSQLLNWYEEGTWTPVLKFGGATTGITYTTQTGTYTRIGRMVHARATIVLSSNGSASGGALVTGLPYTVAVTTAASIYQSGISYTGSLNVAVEGTVDRFTIQQVSEAGVNSNLDRTNFSNTASITLAVCYQV